MPFCFFYLRTVSGDLFHKIILVGKPFITILRNGKMMESGIGFTRHYALRNEFDKGKRSIRPLELAKLAPDAQIEAYAYVYETKWENGRDALVKTKPVNLQSFKEQLRKNILMALATAPFPIDSKQLRGDAVACADCPERTGANVLFAELAEDDLCLNKKCFGAKTRNFVRIERRHTAEAALLEKARNKYSEQIGTAEAAAEAVRTDSHKYQAAAHKISVLKGQLGEIEKFGVESPFAKAGAVEIAKATEKVVLLTDSYCDAEGGVLTTEQYHPITTKGDHCAFSETGVYAKGELTDKRQLICRRQDCKKHFRSSSSSQNTPPTTDERLARKNELFEIRAGNITRLKVLEATSAEIEPAKFWTNPVFQRLICAVLVELTGGFSTSHLIEQTTEILGINSNELTPDTQTYQTDANVLGIYDRMAERDDAHLTAKLTYLLTVASFGENRHEGTLRHGAVEFLVDLFGTDHAALDAAARVELCALHPNYKKFRLEAEEFQRKLAQTNPDVKAELLPPVFFRPVKKVI